MYSLLVTCEQYTLTHTLASAPFKEPPSSSSREVQVHEIACNNQWHFTTRKLAARSPGRPPVCFCTPPPPSVLLLPLRLLPGFCFSALLGTDSILWYAVASTVLSLKVHAGGPMLLPPNWGYVGCRTGNWRKIQIGNS